MTSYANKILFKCPLCHCYEVTKVEPLRNKRGFVIHHRYKCDKCGYTDKALTFQGALSINPPRYDGVFADD